MHTLIYIIFLHYEYLIYGAPITDFVVLSYCIYIVLFNTLAH